MGIYGELAQRIIKEQNDIVIEIYVNSDLYDQLLESEQLITTLQENVRAEFDLKTDNDKTLTIDIRDIKTMNRGGGGKGQHGCSIKVVEPKKLVGDGIDIVIPGFKKTGEAPYPGAKIPGELNPEKAYVDHNASKTISKWKKTPPEISLALKFADKYQKQLNLIYYKPENEQNQYKLLEEIIKDCDYIKKFTVRPNTEINKKLHDKYGEGKKKESSNKKEESNG